MVTVGGAVGHLAEVYSSASEARHMQGIIAIMSPSITTLTLSPIICFPFYNLQREINFVCISKLPVHLFIHCTSGNFHL